MMDPALVRQKLYVEGFECTVTEMLPGYPRLRKCPAPFVRVIALPGQGGSSETGRTPATAPGSCGLQMMTGSGAVIGIGIVSAPVAENGPEEDAS